MASAIGRWFRSGLRDADVRMAAALAPRPATVVDHYLASSVTIRTIDRVLRRWSGLWSGSSANMKLLMPLGVVGNADWKHRYEATGWILVIAAVTHVILTVVQAPRPGWYWTVIPSMAMGFGLLLLAAVRSAPRP